MHLNSLIPRFLVLQSCIIKVTIKYLSSFGTAKNNESFMVVSLISPLELKICIKTLKIRILYSHMKLRITLK